MRLTEVEVLEINKAINLKIERLEEQKDELQQGTSERLKSSLDNQHANEVKFQEAIKFKLNREFLLNTCSTAELNAMMSEFIEKKSQRKLPF
jgi:hypothetical protein